MGSWHRSRTTADRDGALTTVAQRLERVIEVLQLPAARSVPSFSKDGTALVIPDADRGEQRIPLPDETTARLTPRQVPKCHDNIGKQLLPTVESPWGLQTGPEDDAMKILRKRLTRDFPSFLSHLLTDETLPEVERWLATTRLVEVWLSAMRSAAEAGDEDATFRLPLAVRARFLLLVAPYLIGGDLQRRSSELLGDTERLGWAARRARDVWAAHLLAYEDHPLLANLPAASLERDVIDLAMWSVRLSGAGRQGLDATQRFVLRVIREQLLPRFMLTESLMVARELLRARDEIAAATDGRSRRTSAGLIRCRWPWCLVPHGLVLVMPLLLAFIALSRPPATTLMFALWAITATYILLFTTIASVGPLSAYLALLRLPAGVAIGTSALVAIDGALSPRSSAIGWVTTVLLAFVSYSYLAMEARNHGSSLSASLKRGLRVFVVGLAHAILIVAAALVTVDAVLRGAADFRGPPVWQSASTSELAQTILLGGTGALTLGVLLQVLWDAKPVTYPLERMEWRGQS